MESHNHLFRKRHDIKNRISNTHYVWKKNQMLGKWCLRRSMNYSFTYEETWVCKVINYTTFFIWKHLNFIYSIQRIGSFYLFKHLIHCLRIFFSETNIIFMKHFISGKPWNWSPTHRLCYCFWSFLTSWEILNILRVGYYMFLNPEFCFS